MSMSTVPIRNRIVQLQKEKNKLETSLFRERENIRKNKLGLIKLISQLMGAYRYLNCNQNKGR